MRTAVSHVLLVDAWSRSTPALHRTSEGAKYFERFPLSAVASFRHGDEIRRPGWGLSCHRIDQRSASAAAVVQFTLRAGTKLHRRDHPLFPLLADRLPKGPLGPAAALMPGLLGRRARPWKERCSWADPSCGNACALNIRR